MDAALVGQLVSGAVAILSTAVSVYARQSNKRLEAEQKNDAALLQGVIGRTEAMEFALASANRREGELTAQIRHLEVRFHEKDLEMRELVIRYEALKENYSELSDRYKSAVDELVKHYARSTHPPPPEYPRHLPRPGRLPRDEE